MRWKGETQDERFARFDRQSEVRWAEYKEHKRRSLTWRRWFAWRPIHTINGPWVWLEHVDRRLMCEDLTLSEYKLAEKEKSA